MGRIMGRTGSQVLSDSAARYRLARSRTVKCQHYRHGPKNWDCWVVGPFHSRYYGTTGFGTTRSKAKVALEYLLATEFGFIGRLMLSAIDSADNVGIRYGALDTPITIQDLLGRAGA